MKETIIATADVVHSNVNSLYTSSDLFIEEKSLFAVFIWKFLEHWKCSQETKIYYEMIKKNIWYDTTTNNSELISNWFCFVAYML